MLDFLNNPHPNALPKGEGSTPRRLLILLALSIVITILNALKPIEVDDAVFEQNAAQIARHPLDPYGFTVYWFQWAEPAVWELCPPVLPYWMALGMKLLGGSLTGSAPTLWKLWIFPWNLAFVFGIYSLFRRFCRGLELPLTCMTAFSPAFLPAINLMFDVPAITLGVIALNLLARALDGPRRSGVGLLLLSGLCAGLSTQTKFTGLAVPPMLFTYAALRRRWGAALLAPGVAIAIFIGWELVDVHLYGVSHFLFNLRAHDIYKDVGNPIWMSGAIVSLLGGLGTGGAAVALLGLNAPLLLPLALLAATALGMVLLGFWPIPYFVFIPLGIAVCAAFLAAVVRLLVQVDPNRADPKAAADDHFLACWLLIETAACVGISPFPAARRVMALTLVLTVIAGRLAAAQPSLTGPSALRARRRVFRLTIAFSIAVGCFFEFLDRHDALAQRDIVARAAGVIAVDRKPGQAVYYTGHWGIDFYARAQGYAPLQPDVTRLHAGDWVMATRSGVFVQRVGLAANVVTLVKSLTVEDPVHYSFLPFYYGRDVPLWHLDGPRIRVNVYQVTREFISLSNIPAEGVLEWAFHRREPLPPGSVPAVLRAAASATVRPEVGQIALDEVAHSGIDALLVAVRDPSPAARRWAVLQLQRDPQTPASAAALAALHQRAVHDSDPAVRVAAAAALQALTGRPLTNSPRQ